MKVSVITRHAITNYGSLLQAYATQTIIEQLGYECEIIDYIREDESYQKHEITLLKRKPEWYNNPIKRIAYLMLRQPESVLAGRRFEKERNSMLKLSKLYTSSKALENDIPIADIFMTGSDQVWGPVEDGTYDSSYCLSFVPEHVKKVAYAASFGRVEMDENRTNYFKKWLSRYNYLALREESAVDIVKEFGLNASQVIDPTLLMTKEEWSSLASQKKKSSYVLVYQLHNDKKLGQYAKKVAEYKGLPLIRISTSFHQISRQGKLVWCPNVSEFLAYIKNAECLITDSFHGTAFAINFNTPFVEVLPNNNTGTRNMSILKLTGLEDRILTDINDVELADKSIDYGTVNCIIQEQREKSIEELKKMLSQ